MAKMAKKPHPSRPRKPYPAWRQLSADDIDEILAEAGLEAGPKAKTELRRRINAEILDLSDVRKFRREHAAATRRGKYKRVAEAATRLLKALQECADAETALAFEWDRLAQSPASNTPASVEQIRRKHPEENEDAIVAAARLGVVSQSEEATNVIRTAKRFVVVLQLLAANAQKTAGSVQERLGGKGKPRKIDDTRYALVLAAARIVHSVLEIKPTTALSGSWIRVLTALLSRIENKPISDEGAKALWLDVRKWDR